ncbi:flippase-like domain-containing protein [Sphingobacteriaceae bacterium WQ 2009]|uniref:Flippase-like domain-containing protein n=1 Tax=Rhinopithecimicrobium faecis TaxID=2820698 RepID=A0A8T4H588_9SPHI|nr:flippase-like domain-containing protein [Sphingobacteriaceae bacterium WQ 2009]
MNLKRFWKIAKTPLKIIITSLALYYVFNKVSIKDLKEALWHSNPLFIALALLFYGLSIGMSSLRLNGFLKGINLKISEGYNFKLYLLGLFYNLFLPGGVGGDGYKIFFLKKRFDLKGRQLLSALFFDRLSGFWALALIIVALIIFIPQLNIPNYLPIAAFIGGTGIYYWGISRFFPSFKERFIETHFKALCVQSLQVMAAIMILYALGYNGKFSPFLFLFLASSLVAVIPFNVGGLGMREMVYYWGAGIFLLDQHLAVLFSLVFYVISATIAVSGIYFIFQPKALGTEKLPSSKELESANNLND